MLETNYFSKMINGILTVSLGNRYKPFSYILFILLIQIKFKILIPFLVNINITFNDMDLLKYFLLE